MIKLFSCLYNTLLTKKEITQTHLFIFFNFIYIFLDLFSIALILPIVFLAIDGDITSVNSTILNFFNDQVNFFLNKNNSNFFLGIVLLGIFLIKFFVSLYINFFNSRYTNLIIASTRTKLYKNYIKENYSFILNYNTSRLTNLLFPITEFCINRFFVSGLLIFKNFFYAFVIFIFLLFINYKLTISLLFLSSLLLIIYYMKCCSIFNIGVKIHAGSLHHMIII